MYSDCINLIMMISGLDVSFWSISIGATFVLPIATAQPTLMRFNPETLNNGNVLTEDERFLVASNEERERDSDR